VLNCGVGKGALLKEDLLRGNISGGGDSREASR